MLKINKRILSEKVVELSHKKSLAYHTFSAGLLVCIQVKAAEVISKIALTRCISFF